MKLITQPDYTIDNPRIISHLRQALAGYNPLATSVKSRVLQLFFTGITGSGKTYLAKAVLRSILAELKAVSDDYTLASDCDRVRAQMKFLKARDMYKVGDDGIIRGSFIAPYAVLDDLGKEPATEAACKHMSNLICERHDLWQKGRIYLSIITTELCGDELEKRYKEHVIGRIHEQYLICPFNDINHRESKKIIIG